jgi:hypothetical protein
MAVRRADPSALPGWEGEGPGPLSPPPATPAAKRPRTGSAAAGGGGEAAREQLGSPGGGPGGGGEEGVASFRYKAGGKSAGACAASASAR